MTKKDDYITRALESCGGDTESAVHLLDAATLAMFLGETLTRVCGGRIFRITADAEWSEVSAELRAKGTE